MTYLACVQSQGFKSDLSLNATTNSHGVTGGVYKARERIHRVMLLRDY